ncbi:MAG: hypothetical protein JSS27_03870 [Planctomycetes bacterium]|nr:hypothetical protein [Planctomycetota bacterium]
MPTANRRSSRRLTLATGLLLLATQLGCTSLLFFPMYLIKGNTVKADYDGLKGKKVAIVCRPLVELHYSAGSVSNDLSRLVGILLEKNVKKVEIIDADRVAEWSDEHNWEDYAEVGEALGADLVLGIDLGQFSLHQGQTLYQGRAKTVLTVYDIKDKGRIVYEKRMPQTVFPPNTGIPASEKPDEDFRRQFLVVLADRIGRYFYDRDATTDFAEDSRGL